ncbi:MAG: acyl-ACP--UDP-N-acetylglucosamine O-acyltransferase [Fimbriimonadaceae bacterium]
MARIHDLAHIASGAQIADDVIIGPFCNVEAEVVIGAGCTLDSHVTIKSGTTLGTHNYVGQGAVLGGDPQDRKFSSKQKTYLKIGNDNVFREYVTVHRATGDGNATTIANNCFVMAYSHVGHNCTIGEFVTIANNVNLAGHVTVEDLVTIGGMVGVHQFARIGRAAMVGGMSGASRDVPPFVIMSGRDVIIDINAVGLRRIGLSQPARLALHKAVKLMYKSELGMTNAIEIVKREVQTSPEIEYLIAFEERRFRGKSGRGDQP